jgi:ectoine hydroxylase-related dioxygenase (phytanoyl-CoA dioxygenase family)
MKITPSRYVRLIKQGLKDYRWMLFYIQRMDYNPSHRNFISSAIAKFLPKTSSSKLDDESKQLSKVFKEEGYVVIEDLLSKTQVEEMRAYLDTKLCIDPQHFDKGAFSVPESIPKESVHAYYSNEDSVNIPHLWELANDPKILSIVEDRFGAKPTISLLSAWWVFHSFDTEANASEVHVNKPGEFHRDIDDWSQVRLYIGLTDVDEDAGPHAYIKSSHKWMLPPKSRGMDIDDPNFPMKDNLVKLTGEAGMAWLGNTYVLHRGIIPKTKHRLMITVTYTFAPIPYAPSSPMLPCPDRNKFDPYINRVYMKYD